MSARFLPSHLRLTMPTHSRLPLVFFFWLFPSTSFVAVQHREERVATSVLSKQPSSALLSPSRCLQALHVHLRRRVHQPESGTDLWLVLITRDIEDLRKFSIACSCLSLSCFFFFLFTLFLGALPFSIASISYFVLFHFVWFFDLFLFVFLSC